MWGRKSYSYILSPKARHGKSEGSTEIVVQLVDPNEKEDISSHKCNYCLKESNVVSLKRCGNCKGVYYCSTKCQPEHWKKHSSLSYLTKKKNDSLCGTYISHLTPKTRSKMIKLVAKVQSEMLFKWCLFNVPI